MSEARPMGTDAPVRERGPEGVVLPHGFGGTPTEPRGLGEALAGVGYTVHAPQANLEDLATVAYLRKVARVPVSALQPVSAEQVVGQVGSRDKQLVWLERSGHQLQGESEREQVQRTVAAWLQARAEVG